MPIQDSDINPDMSDGAGALSEFQKQALTIRSQKINWPSYHGGGMITKDQYDILVKLDPQYTQSEARAEYFANNHQACVRTLLSIVSQLASEPTVQYLLTLMDDLLQEDQKRVALFRDALKSIAKSGSMWHPLTLLLNRSQPFIIHQTSRIIAKLACWGESRMDGKDLDFYLQWLYNQMKTTESLYAVTAARCLQMMLRFNFYRAEVARNGGIELLCHILEVLESGQNYQLIYQVGFCLWCLSFKPELSEALTKSTMIKSGCKVIMNCNKEKVTRIFLTLFRNMLEVPEDYPELIQQNAVAMVHGHLLRQLENYTDQTFDDEDIKDDIDFLKQNLHSAVQDLSSYDEYVAELRSGILSWTPVHKSERFWCENAQRFNEKNYEVLKMLAALLSVSEEPLTLCVAAHDIGQYITHYRYGKNILEKLGAKEQIMKLLAEHQDQSVKYHSLLALQKMMVSNWKYLEMKSLTDATNTSST